MNAVLVDLGGGPAPGAAWQQMSILAEEAPPPGKGPEFGEASPLGLVVVLLLAVATIFLIRSMSKRIRRLPASFDDPAPDTQPPDTQTAGSQSADTRPEDTRPADVRAPGQDSREAGGRA